MINIRIIITTRLQTEKKKKKANTIKDMKYIYRTLKYIAYKLNQILNLNY